MSGVARRSFLSLTAAFVLAGFPLGKGGLEVLEVEAEMLQTAWRLPLRKLVLAMPLTGALVALAAKAATDLSWTQAFLLGALLSRTGISVVFGSLLTLGGLFGDGLAAVAIAAFTLLVARPVAVFLALAGTGTGTATKVVHVLVRAQGRGDDDLLAADPLRGCPGQ